MKQNGLSRWMAIGALIALGGVAGFAFGKWLKRADVLTSAPSLADIGALCLAAALTAQGAYVFALSLSRAAAGAALGGRDDEPRPASPAQLASYRMQAGVLLLAGAMLALPVVADLVFSLSHDVAIAAIAVTVLGFGVQSALNWSLWRRSDEFARRLMSEASLVCFWVVQSALFLWAVGERLTLLPHVDAWSLVVLLMAVYVAASAFVGVRSGATA